MIADRRAVIKIAIPVCQMKDNRLIAGHIFSIYALLNSEVTAPMFTKFLHNLEALPLHSQGDTAFPFGTP